MAFGASPDRLALSPAEYLAYQSRERDRKSRERLSEKELELREKSQKSSAAAGHNAILMSYYKMQQDKRQRKKDEEQERRTKLEERKIKEEQRKEDKNFEILKLELGEAKAKGLLDIKHEYDMERSELDNRTKLKIAEIKESDEGVSFGESGDIAEGTQASVEGMEQKVSGSTAQPSKSRQAQNVLAQKQEPTVAEQIRYPGIKAGEIGSAGIQFRSGGIRGQEEADFDTAVIYGTEYGVGAIRLGGDGKEYMYVGRDKWIRADDPQAHDSTRYSSREMTGKGYSNLKENIRDKHIESGKGQLWGN